MPDDIRARAADVLAARQHVVGQHRADWGAMRRLMHEVVRAAERLDDRQRARTMRIVSETMEIIHAGEKRAWGLRKPRRKA